MLRLLPYDPKEFLAEPKDYFAKEFLPEFGLGLSM